MSTRIRTAASLNTNDRFELFNVQYRVTAPASPNEFDGVVIRFQVDEDSGFVHQSLMVVPPSTPVHIL